MLTLARTPLSLVTKTHYAMGNDASANDKPGHQNGRRRSARVTEKENQRADVSSLDDEGFAFRSKKGRKTTTTTAAAVVVSTWDRVVEVNGARGGRGGSAARDAESGVTAGKRKQQAYDEDDDGFTFTRTKSKKAKTGPAPATNVPDTVVEEPVQDEVVQPKARPGRPRGKMRSRGMPEEDASESTSAHNRQEQGPSEQDGTIQKEAPRRKAGRPPKRPVKSPEADNDRPPPQLRVERKRPRQKSPPTFPPTQQENEHRDRNGQDNHHVPPQPETQRSRTPPAAAAVPGTTKIALPFADTPIIRRNQEMRRRASGIAPGQGERDGRGSRRSSLGQRGRRASSLIDSGRSSALPHDAVDSAEFFKHIEAELPEPRRMRQLLTWCATRVLGDAKKADKDPSSSAKGRVSVGGKADKQSHVRLAAREIQSQILRDFGVRSDMSDWFGRPEDTEENVGRETVLKKPNPRNEANEKKIKELEAQLTRLQFERTTWESLLMPPDADKPFVAPLPSSAVSHPSALPAANDASLLTPGNASILALLRSLDLRTAPVLQEQTRRRLDAATRDLEFDVDRLAESVHVLGRYRDLGRRAADAVLDRAAAALDVRARRERERSGTAEVGVRDVLRGLSRIENR